MLSKQKLQMHTHTHKYALSLVPCGFRGEADFANETQVRREEDQTEQESGHKLLIMLNKKNDESECQ